MARTTFAAPAVWTFLRIHIPACKQSAGCSAARGSTGVHATVRPGEVNLMTAGGGICHSEVSIAADLNAAAILHGVQLWAALPDSDRNTSRDFEHFAPEPVSLPGAVARIFLGRLAG